MTKFMKSVSVYDASGTYLGRIEAFDGDFENYLPTFLPSEEEINSEELREIADHIEQIKENQ